MDYSGGKKHERTGVATLMANNRLGRIRMVLAVFMAGLILSGLTAFPLETELKGLTAIFPWPADAGITQWLVKVRDGLMETNAKYPFIAYGTDWLAFAHLVIAIAFIGPLRDPVKNIWVIEFGMIACVAVIPLALIAGGCRGIPLGWRFIDCSFGVFGILPLGYCWRATKKLETGRVG